MAERRRTVPKTSERLGRMLVIVPYLVQHQGAELGQVAGLFDLPADQLRRDLDLLFMSGLPPYGPGDLIDVEVDEDDHIWITMADHFARPLRLTRSEALSLYLRGTELVATPGLPEAPALASAMRKLGDELGPEAMGDAGSRIETAGTGRVPEHLDLLRRAARSHETLQIEYYAPSTGVWSTRLIQPEEVFASLGNWYVAAWDTAAGAERLFRADRIRSAESTHDTFVPRGLEGVGRPLYTPGADDLSVRLRLHPAARWIAEYYTSVDPDEGTDGTLEVTLPTARLGWVARLLLRAGSDADVISPPELAAEVKDLALRTLERYPA